MKFIWVKTHWIIKKIFPKYIWDLPNNENKIYLTFDDGPTPEITDWTLNLLKQYNAKATFFCIGENIQKYPEIYQKILSENHSIGNHTFNHLNGWKTYTKDYLLNSKLCESQMLSQFEQSSQASKLETQNPKFETVKLFRPPYGKIKTCQSKGLQKLGYKIIMWDVISYDFDTTISKEKCLENVINNATSGSIIVFHDSLKAFPNLEYVLPKTLELLSKKGFVFEKLN